MKVQVPLLQLPVRFDAAALAEEVAQIEEHWWRPHPNKLPGNTALTLVTTGGDPDSDELGGQMLPTPVMERLPKLRAVMASLGCTWGRSRLMRLSGQAEVTAHVDTAYYWRERMRVHVPITTTPDVRFQVGKAETNMKAGECWIFDTWSWHRVLNNHDSTRIHLVADTVGGDRLWQLIQRGRPAGMDIPGWQAEPVPLDGSAGGHLDYERVNIPTVMSPYEMREIFVFLLGEVANAKDPRMPGIQQALLLFSRRWQALWAAHGEERDGWPRFRELLEGARKEFAARGAMDIRLRNETPLGMMLEWYVFGIALNDGQNAVIKDAHGAPPPAPVPGPRAASDFDRPVFLVSPPRSGSTLMFETLVGAPGVHTIGDESHALIEGVPGLAPNPANDSNRLTAAHATDAIAGQLRQRFFDALRDRDGRPPAGSPVRMLEKTPKNALRIPFLKAVFPDARFVYLHRDPRQVLASMIEGWNSGHFVMYPKLPGWQGPPWSFLLTPDWQALSGKPVADIVAGQWETATRVMLDDLAALDPADWTGVDHDAFLADPQGTVRRIADWAGWGWDRELGELPHSKYTLTPPSPDKWRKHAAAIEPRLAAIADLVGRAARAAGA